jgi:hypothetical protein
MRFRGKSRHFTPEQFSEEWEHWRIPGLDPLPAGSARYAQQVAGKYTDKTNLWGLALCMWEIITKYQPPEGPVPEAVRQPDGTTKWTFGSFLRGPVGTVHPNVAYVDEDLRNLVAACLYELPADRPSMKDIENIIQWKMQQYNQAPPPGEDNAACAAWVKTVFGEPSVPAPLDQAGLDAVSGSRPNTQVSFSG